MTASAQKINIEALKNKLPLIVTAACCVMVGTLSVAVHSVKNSDTGTAAAYTDSVPKQVIVLDAGHGGLDSGCVAINGAYEKDINLSIVQDLGALLSLNGYEVVYTRSDDRSIHDDGVEGIRNQKVSDMENRLEIVNRYPDSIFISVHQNQFTESEYFGAQMFYTTNNKGNFRLATIMQDLFAQLQPGNDREVKLIDNGLYLFKNTKQPALLIECGFLSNPNDAANLSSPEYRKKVAFTIYRGITEYLSGSSSADTSAISESGGYLYMQ